MERTAVCSCGQLSVTVDGDPAYHGLCSCLECQKVSGGAFTYSGYWPRSSVKNIVGESKCWRRVADSGRWFEQYFCPTCASVVYGYGEFDLTKINIAIGNFADPGFPSPTYAIWNKFKHPWVQMPESCKGYDDQPGPDAEDALTG